MYSCLTRPRATEKSVTSQVVKDFYTLDQIQIVNKAAIKHRTQAPTSGQTLVFSFIHTSGHQVSAVVSGAVTDTPIGNITGIRTGGSRRVWTVRFKMPAL